MKYPLFNRIFKYTMVFLFHYSLILSLTAELDPAIDPKTIEKNDMILTHEINCKFRLISPFVFIPCILPWGFSLASKQLLVILSFCVGWFGPSLFFSIEYCKSLTIILPSQYRIDNPMFTQMNSGIQLLLYSQNKVKALWRIVGFVEKLNS